MDKNLIAVVIPVFNEQQTITACLRSLLNQSLPAREIIVIDDGSTDSTVKKIKRLQKQFPKIKLLQQQHQGPAVARNQGAKVAKSDILVFVDADMEFETYFLENLTEPIIKHQAIGTWSGNEWVKNWDNLWARCWNYNQNRSDARMIGPSRGQKRVFRSILKSEFLKVGGYDPIGYTDDWTLVAKLEQKPFVTQAKFYHYNPDSLLTVFRQSCWIGKREYKLGRVGTLITIFKANAAVSLFIGIAKAMKYQTSGFVVFKLVYDLGIFIGAIEGLLGKKY